MKSLRQLRLEKGVGQARAAVGMNVSIAALSSWEKGKSRPNELNQRKLADYYGVDISELELAPPRSSGRRPLAGVAS